MQSVVFDTAYNTNENLLISAPTGAGKTNVAMATILREVKQNIQQGVVMKDKFKVSGAYFINVSLLIIMNYCYKYCSVFFYKH